jgi:hypothetical protein
MNIINHKQGQGLLELIIAIGVISVGLFGVWGLFLSNYTAQREAQARIIGANLAREGVELVKNIRDSNWLLGAENIPCVYDGASTNPDPCRWDSGLLGDGTARIMNPFSTLDARGDNDGETLELDFNVDNLSDDLARLYRDEDGFYSHEMGSSTVYRRIIETRVLCCTAGTDDNLRCANASYEMKDLGLQCSTPSELLIGINVRSQVGWIFNDSERDIVIEDQLFNWK